jgi:hypothetical protein
MNVDIQTELDTEVAPELIREALLDFTERRLETWKKTLDPETYEVHWVEATSAEVTEGSPRPKVWSRERYDWSDPTTITWTAQESNFCTPGSHIAMNITPLPEGGSHLMVRWQRSNSNLRGWLYFLPVKIGGSRLLTWATRQALEAIRRSGEERRTG